MKDVRRRLMQNLEGWKLMYGLRKMENTSATWQEQNYWDVTNKLNLYGHGEKEGLIGLLRHLFQELKILKQIGN